MKNLAILIIFLLTVSCTAKAQPPLPAQSTIENPTAFVSQATITFAPTPTPSQTPVPPTATLIPDPLPADDNNLFYMIQRGDTLESVAAKVGLTTDELTGLNDSEMIKRFRPDTQLALFDRASILARIYSEPGKKLIVVVGEQKAYAADGNTSVHEPFIISTGIPAHPSPIGKFAILYKLKSIEMTGQSDIKGRIYDLFGVPWDMNFYSVFYIHGAYWHNDFGKPHSGGCINFKVDDAKWIYYWSDPLPVAKITYSTKDNPGTTVWVIP